MATIRETMTEQLTTKAETATPISRPTAHLTFAELRLASKLHKPPGAQAAMAQLQQVAQQLVTPETVERFVDGEPIGEAQRRLLRRKDRDGLLARTLADMVIQIDRFAAMNDIDLAAEIRKRFEPEHDRK